jgi:putative PIN family toxin of toxin-antitoxin system
MPKRKDKVIIDTNLWISFLLTKDYSKLDKILSNQELTLLFSTELLDEFIGVANRPKFTKYFNHTDLQDLLIQIRLNAIFVKVTSDIQICRDNKDNFFSQRWESNTLNNRRQGFT